MSHSLEMLSAFSIFALLILFASPISSLTRIPIVVVEMILGAVAYGGVSVHWVNEELDGGEIILQEKLEKIPNESLEGFESRIHALEYTLYPKAILKALHLLPQESSPHTSKECK